MGRSLADLIDELRRFDRPRIAIVGIGNRLNGDDAAGPLVAQALKEKLGGAAPQADRFLVLDAGPSPEAFSGPLRRFSPDLILMVDAAELSQPPGTVEYFDWSVAQGMSASTHTLPPSLLAKFLIDELGCQIRLLGIQPGQLNLDGGVSPEVGCAIDEVVQNLYTWMAYH